PVVGALFPLDTPAAPTPLPPPPTNAGMEDDAPGGGAPKPPMILLLPVADAFFDVLDPPAAPTVLPPPTNVGASEEAITGGGDPNAPMILLPPAPAFVVGSAAPAADARFLSLLLPALPLDGAAPEPSLPLLP
ncbi:unnamed protein product, partial [Ectocarpus sp. 12 AP-2014]